MAQDLFDDVWPTTDELIRQYLGYESPAEREKKNKELAERFIRDTQVLGAVGKFKDIPPYAREFLIELSRESQN